MIYVSEIPSLRHMDGQVHAWLVWLAVEARDQLKNTAILLINQIMLINVRVVGFEV